MAREVTELAAPRWEVTAPAAGMVSEVLAPGDLVGAGDDCCVSPTSSSLGSLKR